MYSILEKVKIVEFYEETNSVVATQRKFCHHYNVRRSPSSKTVKNIVAKFKTKAQNSISTKGHLGVPRNAALWKILKLSGCQSLKTLRKVIGNVLIH